MSSRNSLVGTLLAITLALVSPSAQAQRGERVEGLLRGFLELQMQKERQKAIERQRALEQQRNQQPARPSPASPIRVEASPQMQSYRSSLGAFSTQANTLANALEQSSVDVRGVRSLMPEMLKLKTTAAIMHEHARETHDLDLVRDSYRDLDNQWRNLSFQLQQLRGIDSTTTGFIRKLDGHCDSICNLFHLKHQFNRGAILRLAFQTEAHLRTLLESIEYDLYDRDGAEPLASKCRGLAEQCRRLGVFVSDASYDDVITKYSSFVTDWRTLATELYPYQDPHCSRCIRRIRTCNQQVFEQLRLPLSIDRAYLSHVSRGLSEEVNSLFENMTIRSLIQLPPAQQQAMLSAARELYGQCEHYCKCVEQNAPLDDLMSDYIAINDQWTTLDRYLSPLAAKSVVASRRTITAHDHDLRGLLRVPSRMNREHALQLAASLEEVAQHLRYDVRRYGRYYRTATFRDQAYQASDAFYLNAKSLRDDLQTTSDIKKLQARCNSAVTSWESFSKVITAMPQNGLTSSRYQFVDQSRQELLPVIAELATLLGA